ncbi:hypothetical protein [Fimbriiglobus ruber]|uniref:Uncharacterized protein n=1 Tax=Fimbriiglobus ruber TaxID=1908690 RepID=A0A225E083_9BACT|nr:hypothetical protein [Fimbriiglobus ruber]OWK47011.1 hypothetical protein FRUB_00710 [Fimbriiglobus ruber]
MSPSPRPKRPAAKSVWAESLARFNDPAARTYVFLGMGALLVVGTTVFLNNGPLAAILPCLLAVAGLLVRQQTAMPILFLVSLAALIIDPVNLWLYGSRSISDIPRSHFRLTDLILAVAVTVYFLSQFRLFSLTSQAMPSDTPGGGVRPGGLIVRPGGNVPDDEIARLLMLAAGCAIAAQFVWAFLALRVDFRAVPPLTIAKYGSPTEPGNPSQDWSRFLIFAGIVAAVVVPAGLVFWYWRLNRLTAPEARMILLDILWREGRREFNRQEKWRAWGRTSARPVEAPLPKLRPRAVPQPTTAKRRGCASAIITTGCLLLVAMGIAGASIALIIFITSRR